MADNPTTKQSTPSTLTVDVMTAAVAMAIENRLHALEKHYALGENSLGFIFGCTPQIAGANGGMMSGYIARIWLWNGLIDVASVTRPSLEAAINSAFQDATVVLPQYKGTTSKQTRVA